MQGLGDAWRRLYAVKKPIVKNAATKGSDRMSGVSSERFLIDTTISSVPEGKLRTLALINLFTLFKRRVESHPRHVIVKDMMLRQFLDTACTACPERISCPSCALALPFLQRDECLLLNVGNWQKQIDKSNLLFRIDTLLFTLKRAAMACGWNYD